MFLGCHADENVENQLQTEAGQTKTRNEETCGGAQTTNESDRKGSKSERKRETKEGVHQADETRI